MLTNAMIVAATQVIFDHILTESGVSNHLANKVRSWLERDPQHLAFQVALMGAYNKFADIHPDFAAALFDEHFLKNRAAPLLARCLPPADPPEPSQLASAFADERNLKGAAHKRCVVKTTPIAEQFLNELRRQLRACEEFNARFDSIELERTAIATRQAADALQALRAELKQLLAQQPGSVTITQNIIIFDQNLDSNESPNPRLSATRREISGILAPFSNALTKPLGWLRRALLGSPPAQPTRLFICYQPNAHKDSQVADYLYNYLTDQGYEVFMDKPMAAETPWSEQIGQPLRACEFLVVLLSQESVHSEMVRAEVRRAYEYRKLREQPRTLVVRMAYEGRLPQAIDAFLDPLQYVSWQSSADNEPVAQQILAAIEGRFIAQRPVQPPHRLTEADTSGDGQGEEHSSPSKIEPYLLDELPAPSGIMHGKFYIKRAADARFKREIVKKGGTLTTIRAARQTGKTSLLVEGVHHARQNRIKVVNLDLLRMERAHLQTSERFYRYLAEFIVWELGLDVDQVEQLWRGQRGRGSQDKLSRVLTYVLAESDQPIMLAMDDVDRLLETDFHTDFFALVRSWHNRRGFDELWRKLNLVLAISTEPHLLIADSNQSPFNVGQRIELKDFDAAQVRDLNQRHGSPVQEGDMAQMMKLLNGHPYLTRQALYTLITESLSWSELIGVAVSEQGPFAQHLRRYYWLLHDKHDLKAALKQVIRQKRCLDEMTFYRLLRAGLISGKSKSCTCRCGLYRMYFEDKF